MADRFDIARLPSAALIVLPAVAVAWAGPAAAQGGNQAGDTGPSAPHVIECPASEAAEAACSADLTTYLGWRVFERYCARCHGRDAEGSTFAPSLVHRLRRFDRRAFHRALDEGYAGPSEPMRPWGEHPQVARYYDELWAYLSARANGDLPAGPLRPRREGSVR